MLHPYCHIFCSYFFFSISFYFLFCSFIGELYKQGILTTKIMQRCMSDMLIQNDEDSLECLCKLLTTIGKDLEGKVSSEVSFYILIDKKNSICF